MRGCRVPPGAAARAVRAGRTEGPRAVWRVGPGPGWGQTRAAAAAHADSLCARRPYSFIVLSALSGRGGAQV